MWPKKTRSHLFSTKKRATERNKRAWWSFQHKSPQAIERENKTVVRYSSCSRTVVRYSSCSGSLAHILLRSPFLGANSSNKCRTCSFRIHKQNCSLASPALRCGVAWIQQQFLQFKAGNSRKNWCKNITVPWNSRGRSMTQNCWIIFEKCWKTQLWRFEQVFEHFIMFTELVNTF